jgi:hypothetical protein
MPRKKKDKQQTPPNPIPPPARPDSGIRIEKGNFVISFD